MQLAGHVEPKPGGKVQPTSAAVRKERRYANGEMSVGVGVGGGVVKGGGCLWVWVCRPMGGSFL